MIDKMEKMTEINNQTTCLLKCLVNINVTCEKFVDSPSEEKRLELVKIVETCEKEFDILKQVMAGMVVDFSDGLEEDVVEVIETDNGFKISSDENFDE